MIDINVLILTNIKNTFFLRGKKYGFVDFESYKTFIISICLFKVAIITTITKIQIR